MRLIDIVNGPWAILSETHREIQDIYKRHLKGDKINIKDLGIEKRDPLSSSVLVSAADGRRVESRGTYMVIDNVAVIPVHDVIAKRMTWFMEVCGGCSSQIFMRDYVAAQNDPGIVGIIPYFDTPGGTVDGTAEAAAVISQYRGNKPVIGFTDGMICSAGYWMAAPCDSLYISSDTNPIGSIGVVAAHVDVSKRLEMFGQRVTEITAGEYKRIASAYSPLTKEGLAYIQGQLNHIYTAFTDFVGEHRGLSIDDHEQWANGRVFLGSQAISFGLVDGVSTLEDLIDQLAAGSSSGRTHKQKAAAGDAGAKPSAKEHAMNKEELKAKHPELYQAVLDEGREAAATENAKAAQKAAEDERTRIVALVSAGFGEEPGKKFAAVVGKGLSAEDLSALGISFGVVDSSLDLESRNEILEGLRESGQQPLGKTKGEGTDDFYAKVKAYRAEHACGKGTAISAMAKAYPDLHKAWLDKQGQ